MSAVGIIPARMAATRFPGKPLALIAGMTMLEHVYRRAKLCEGLSEVLVATCDDMIRLDAQRLGARVVMTSDRHERAMERTAEAAAQVPAEVIVMIQGDEPLLHPAMLEELLAPFRREPQLECANLMLALSDDSDVRDPDQIKVVCDGAGNALYMSREPIPTRHRGVCAHWRQIGIMAFRRDFLLRLVSLPMTPLERAESVDLLRAIEHGFTVRMVPTRHVTFPVDAPEDVAIVERLMREEAVVKEGAPRVGQGMGGAT